MTGDLGDRSRQAPAEVNEQFTDQDQREDDAAVKMDVWHHPFDWWDFLLFMMPIATVAITMWWDAPR